MYELPYTWLQIIPSTILGFIAPPFQADIFYIIKFNMSGLYLFKSIFIQGRLVSNNVLFCPSAMLKQYNIQIRQIQG